VRPSARRILIQTSGKRRSVRFSVVGLVSVMVELALCYRACEWRSVRLCRGKRTTLGLMAGSGICDNVLVASAIEWPPWLGLEPATVWEYLVAGSPYFTIAPTLSLILIWTDNRFVLLLIVVSPGAGQTWPKPASQYPSPNFAEFSDCALQQSRHPLQHGLSSQECLVKHLGKGAAYE
jgi:hypothetical protein